MVRDKGVWSMVCRLLLPLAAALTAAAWLSQPVAAGAGAGQQAPGRIVVENAPGRAVPEAAPGVTTISPNCGDPAGGTPVTIIGSNFTAGTTQVVFGAAAGVDEVVWGTTLLTVRTPPGAAGPVGVGVITPGGGVAVPAGFTYSTTCWDVVPAITSVSPAKVRARSGTFTLTVAGSNFLRGAIATWGGAAKATTYVSSTQLEVLIPGTEILNPASVLVRVMNPTGQWSANFPVPVIPSWQIVGAGDFTNDGRADLVWESADGYIALWRMNTYTQTGAELLYPNRIAIGGWHVKAVGDLNGDGWADLVWENTVDGNVAAWYMNGTTQAYAAVIAAGAMVGGWHAVAAGDLDGDGYAEVIVQNDNGLIGAWFKQGDDPRLLHPTPVALGGFNIVGAGDINLDGKDDLIWQAPNGTTPVWLMNGSTQLGVVVTAIPAVPARAAAVADFDATADGIPDLVLQYDNGGLLGALMSPLWATIKGSGMLVPGLVYSRVE